MIEKITFFEIDYAIVMRDSFNAKGISFVTGGDSLLELGYMNHDEGYVVKPHYHPKVKRVNYGTQEVIFIKKGSVKINFYSKDNILINYIILFKGDWIVFLNGGHGLEMLENTELIEVKNGPYLNDKDKVRF